MSGGSFNYAYHDARQLAETISDMREHAEEYNYPDHVIERLQTLEEELSRSPDFLRTVEWVASGDYSIDELENGD